MQQQSFVSLQQNSPHRRFKTSLQSTCGTFPRSETGSCPATSSTGRCTLQWIHGRFCTSTRWGQRWLSGPQSREWQSRFPSWRARSAARGSARSWWSLRCGDPCGSPGCWPHPSAPAHAHKRMGQDCCMAASKARVPSRYSINRSRLSSSSNGSGLHQQLRYPVGILSMGHDSVVLRTAVIQHCINGQSQDPSVSS